MKKQTLNRLTLLLAFVTALSVRAVEAQTGTSLVEEVFTLRKPDDIALALQTMREEIMSAGGDFSGNESAGFVTVHRHNYEKEYNLGLQQ
jgi:uncharacterized tellurite resistance protein B-like protein